MPTNPDPHARALDLAARGFEVYLRDVLKSAIYPESAPLRVEAYQPAAGEHPSYAEALAADYVPVRHGWRWGPKWSTCWFRVSSQVPTSFESRSTHLRFSCGTEATLWLDNEPRQGFDVHRDAYPWSGVEVLAHIEAACNHPFGVVTFEWDAPDTHARWNAPDPGRVERAELAVFDPDAWELARRYELGVQLLRALDPSSPRARQLLAGMQELTDAHRRGEAARASHALDGLLRVPSAGSTPVGFAVGHAHLDTAWLWPIRETRRKFVRTACNVLGLMDRHPEFRFLCSQAQQYAWLEQDAPAVFERVRARVAEGVWTPEGGMWIEPDCNVVSGESLIRQVLHADRYWTSRFGETAAQRVLYLPDTFGFPASLPQIMRATGLDTFITNKLSWNAINDFPHTSFYWRGLDGCEVLAHCTPGGDYNASQTPKEMLRAVEHLRAIPAQGPAVYLQPFGFGDGGGGPTDWSIRNTQLAEDCDGLPRQRLGGVGAFVDALREQADRSELPVWDGELYLELHRGTLTTQSWIKQANRRAEFDLRLAEAMTFAGPHSIEPERSERAMAKLDRAWKLLLLNQFHDIIPGSSIAEVYDDARRDFEEIDRLIDQLFAKATKAWATAFDTTQADEPALVINPSGHERSGVFEVETDGVSRLKFAKRVPALGAAVVDLRSSSECVPVTAGAIGEGADRRYSLANGVIEAVIDARGRVMSLARIGGREVVPESTADAGLNVLCLYDDRPHAWDAWEIDPGYEGSARPVDGECERWELVEQGPLRARLVCERSLGRASRLRQEFVLDAGAPRLDVRTWVDWHESHTMLRVLNPVDVRATSATYGIQFGHVRRSTHVNTTLDAAMFEVCAHGWADLSEPGLGVAILDDGKHGRSCRDNVMGVTLLRSPTHPDPGADRGEHTFTYSMLPHEGDWRAAMVDVEAELLSTPMRAR
ncbi:MAG: glycoside hydrolase family 38 C-terminal domain-containing protein, partial [Planctomycetota bacterium]